MFASQPGSDGVENFCVEVTSTSIAGQEADVYEFDFGWFVGNLVGPSA